MEDALLTVFEKLVGYKPFGNRMKAAQGKASAIVPSTSD